MLLKFYVKSILGNFVPKLFSRKIWVALYKEVCKTHSQCDLTKNSTKWANHNCILLVPYLRKHDECPIGAKRCSSRFGMDLGRRTSHGRRSYENERRRRFSLNRTIGRRHERVSNFGIILDSVKFQKGTVTQN